ncbi:MAG: putative addiction module antidote protein [Gammaproteobacteria bacterium]|nr:putative addiction module antidote protein [Gammaproteobacteria bacterium]
MKIKKFDVVDFLDSDEAIIEYLNAALEEGDSDFFVKAVGDVARAKGMMKVARTTGLGRQNLYRSLSRGGNPRVGTLFRVLDTLDVRLSVARK